MFPKTPSHSTFHRPYGFDWLDGKSSTAFDPDGAKPGLSVPLGYLEPIEDDGLVASAIGGNVKADHADFFATSADFFGTSADFGRLSEPWQEINHADAAHSLSVPAAHPSSATAAPIAAAPTATAASVDNLTTMAANSSLTTSSTTMLSAQTTASASLSPTWLVGVNLAGAEFGSSKLPGTYGYDYIYPSHSEIDYYASKGMAVIRLPFLWERLQPTEFGTLSSSELSHIDDVVNYANSKGLKVILDPHDYGSYNGSLIGSTAVPNTAFADFWGKLADHFAANANVLFGLMNEPHTQTATQWLGSVNAAISAIRVAGAASQEILVPGSYWDGAWTWTTTDNASVIGTGVQDPSHNFAFEVHQYLDSDGSGTHSTVVSTSVGVDRLTAITNWAESTGNHLFLGEVGIATDQTSLTALGNMLGYMQAHTDAWQGVTYWAGGPWWGSYMYSIEPSGGVDKPQMGVLTAHLAAYTTPPTVSVATIGSITNQPSQAISGTVTANTAAAIGTTVYLYDNGGTTPLATATLGTGGAWAATVSLAGDGTHSIIAMDTDSAGNTGASNAVVFTLDTIAPAVTESLVNDTGSSSTDKITSNPALTGSGDPNAVVHFTVDGVAIAPTATANAGGAWSFTPTGLADGSHTIVASETDAAGNTGIASLTFTLDTHAPLVTESLANDTGFSSTDKITSNPALTGSGDPNAVVHFTVDGAAIAPTATANAGGAWSFTPTGLADGSHTIVASETDAGNTGTASLTFTLDTTKPVPVIAHEALNGNGTVTLSGTSEAGSSIAVLDGATQIGTTAVGSNGAWSFTTGNLSTTVHTFTVTGTDTAGNSGTGSGAAVFGSSKGDTIAGTSGNDLIMGAGGGDRLSGGAGTDTFIFASTADSQPGANKFDTITDFVHGSDHMDFSAISGLNSNIQTVNINFLTGAAPTSIAAHTIDVVVSGGNTTIYANASGATETMNNNHEDIQINLIGVASLTALDFLLH